MRKKLIIIILSLLILIGVISIYSSFAIHNQAEVRYIKDLPGKMLATTIPPFGIYIKEQYKNEGDAPKSILAHERIHWLQYQERGLFGFYYEYLGGWLKNGRFYNNLEMDARKRSSY